MKYCIILLLICTSAISLTLKKAPPIAGVSVEPTLKYIKQQSIIFGSSTSSLETAIRAIDVEDPATIIRAVAALKQSRLQFKKIEFFLTYFLKSATLVYNEANKFEVEEPYMEAREPAGFQVIEAMLFSQNAVAKKQDLLQQAILLNTSAQDIPALLYNLEINDKQIAESIRLELIRMITLGITGFDTPELKTGIIESREVLLSMRDILFPLITSGNVIVDSVSYYLDSAIHLIDENDDFDSFDRMAFLTKAALPLQYQLGLLIKKSGLYLNTAVALNYSANNLFSSGAINSPTRNNSSKSMINLGRKLFFEKRLSQNSVRSCGTCHQSQKYFTDGIPKSISLNKNSNIERNAPGLYYSTYQYTQFWDGRAKNIEEQIQTVMENPNEMGSDHHLAIVQLGMIKYYRTTFRTAFPLEKDSVINLHNIAAAIGAFLKTLAPMNSRFDQFIAGNKNKLTKNEIKGFNLFMGKALCGTCHYAPLFNGLIPPFYNRTELEALGVTITANFKEPVLDTDSGRFKTYPISYYESAFKTPTLRNVAKTSPYMHNGAFKTLEQVMYFYNKGGGAGLGLNFARQTLSSNPLRLDSVEVSDIIAFLRSLTDRNYRRTLNKTL